MAYVANPDRGLRCHGTVAYGANPVPSLSLVYSHAIKPFGFGNISGLLSRLSARKQIIGIVPTVLDRKHELAAFVGARSSLFDFEAIARAGMEPHAA